MMELMLGVSSNASLVGRVSLLVSWIVSTGLLFVVILVGATFVGSLLVIWVRVGSICVESNVVTLFGWCISMGDCVVGCSMLLGFIG